MGTTSTTSIDPVPAIAEVCGREGLWLHVDAAYAGSAAVVPELRCVLAGCERADSLVMNPHKWLFVPVDLLGPSTPAGPRSCAPPSASSPSTCARPRMTWRPT